MGKWTSVHKGEISAFLQGERSRQQEQDQFQLLEDAGPPLSEIYDIGFNRVPVLAKSAF